MVAVQIEQLPLHTAINLFKSSFTVPVDEAVDIIRSIAHSTGSETILIDEADGRILAVPCIASADFPGFTRSWKNGYAVIASDTSGATEKDPVTLKLAGSIRKGDQIEDTLLSGACFAIRTGGQLPERADAVVMAEDARISGDTVSILSPVSSGENIIRKDEDFSEGEEIYPEGWTIRPQDIGVLASVGIYRVNVRKMPRIGIISTGLELVPSDAVPYPGEVREVNSHLISVFVRRQGAIPVRYGIIRDNLVSLKQMLIRACMECDAVIISGGSSRDKNDITSQAIEELGTIFVHGITIAPGKPTSLGVVNNKPVIGLPGHPASILMVLTLVVVHLIQGIKGSGSQAVYKKTVKMASDIRAKRDHEEFMRVRIDDDIATPTFSKPGLLNTLLYSDGIIRIPPGPGYKAGGRSGGDIMVTRYLNQISLHDAIHILKTRLSVPVRTEMTPVIESAGRMTAAPVFAQISVPGVRVSAMDGFAVRSKDTLSARDQHPVTINDCVRLNTGNPVPEGYDAVIMIEDIRLLDEGIALRSPARPGQHIRLAGEDVRAGRMVLTRGHEIIASDIGALLSYGLVEVLGTDDNRRSDSDRGRGYPSRNKTRARSGL